MSFPSAQWLLNESMSAFHIYFLDREIRVGPELKLPLANKSVHSDCTQLQEHVITKTICCTSWREKKVIANSPIMPNAEKGTSEHCPAMLLLCVIYSLQLNVISSLSAFLFPWHSDCSCPCLSCAAGIVAKPTSKF